VHQTDNNTDPQPLVSVGIPTYNRALGLQRTLSCITQQTYRNLEIIVSDNASPGKETEALVRYLMQTDPRIQYHRQDINQGAIYNFKFVLDQSTGNYFMWAADDDEWEPEFIQICLAQFDEHITLVVPRMNVLYRGNGWTENIALPNVSRHHSRAENVKAFLDIPTPSMIYGLHRRASLIRNYEDFWFDFADCYFVTKILLDGQADVLHGLEKPLYIAGVDGSEYVIKIANPQPNRVLIYYPYITKQTSLIASSSISFKDKIKLLYKVIIGTFRLFLWHEKMHKNAHLINRLKFLIIESLVAFDSRLSWALGKLRSRTQKPNEVISASLSEKVIKVPTEVEKHVKISYSQTGEDLIVKFIFDAIGIQMPTYIDIGAYHPEHLSNTALFYRNGCRGINIEPDPTLFERFKLERSEDINLNLGISNVAGEIDFYILSTPTLNTFSKDEAERCTQQGSHHIVSIAKTTVDVISNVIYQYCEGHFPKFLSLDVEGLDLQILQSIKYNQSSPVVICVETISFSETGNGEKDRRILDFLESKGYMVYADTYINTIFVKKSEWVRS